MRTSENHILGYGCSTAAGESLLDLTQALAEKKDLSQVDEKGRRICTRRNPPHSWPRKPGEYRRDLIYLLGEAFDDALKRSGNSWFERPYGVIFCSTKGELEDYLELGQRHSDPYSGVFNEFLTLRQLRPKKSISVSNACASGLSGLLLAEHWLQTESVETVLVIGADLIGPFILNGFDCLGALSKSRVRSFGENRDGLQLGEGAGAIVLSRARGPFPLRLRAVGCELSGDSPTRPTHAAESLCRIYRRFGPLPPPGWIIAHGTGTPLNDRVENRAFSELFSTSPPKITATKGCMGHTLGASSLIDSALACFILECQKGFSIPNTETIDPDFSKNFVTQNHPDELMKEPFQSVLVSALGFGNIHALAYFEVGP